MNRDILARFEDGFVSSYSLGFILNRAVTDLEVINYKRHMFSMVEVSCVFQCFACAALQRVHGHGLKYGHDFKLVKDYLHE